MMQKRDIRILSCLRVNSREGLTKISKKTNIPISTVYERIQHHKNNSIQKFCALLDFNKLGYMAKASVLLKIRKTDKKKVKEYLYLHQNVNSMSRINNGYDYMIEVVFKNIKDLEEFLENLEDKFKIKHIEVYYIIDELRQEEFVPILYEN